MPHNLSLTTISRSFFAWGWLLVAALPFAQVIGRGVFNVLGVGLLAWGLLSMAIERPRLDGRMLSLYLLMLASFTCSAALAEDPKVAFERLKTFVLYSLLCWPVLAALRTDDDLQKLIDAFAVAAAFSIGTLWVIYFFKFRQPGFIPELHMREDNLPLLLPFLLCYLQQRPVLRYRLPIAIAVTAIVVVYVILSNGRAALLALLVGLSAYILLVAGMRKRTALVLVAGVLVTAWGLRGHHLVRNVAPDSSFAQALNTASSFRMELWQNAIANPPKNIWLGSGMGNIPDVVLTVQGAGAPNLKHLHNFLLDCGYENGLLGLLLLVLFLGCGLLASSRRWVEGSMDQRQRYGTLMAPALAIMTGALFSYSYSSRQFAIYLFVLSGASSAIALRRT